MATKVWTLTEDELDKLAAHARYVYQQARIDALSPGSRIEAWGDLSYGDRTAWKNAVAALLFSLDGMGRTLQTVVIDYD